MFVSRKKKTVSPVIETVGNIKKTLADTPFVNTLARSRIVLPELIGNSAAVVTDLIKVIVITSFNCFVIFICS